MSRSLTSCVPDDACDASNTGPSRHDRTKCAAGARRDRHDAAVAAAHAAAHDRLERHEHRPVGARRRASATARIIGVGPHA